MPRSRALAGALAVLTTLSLSACGVSQTAPAPPTAAPTEQAAASPIQAVVASTDLAVGTNRFTFGVLNNNHPVETGTPHLTFFWLGGAHPVREGTALARFNQFAKGLKDTDANQAAIDIGGVFVAYPTFRSPGKWGVVVQLPVAGRERTLQAAFVVQRHSSAPAVGSPAPRSNNPTTATMPATKLDSGRPPDDMHKLSIAAAIAQHRPLVVLFATAAFCQSRLCGPEIEVVQGIEKRYRGRVNFVHIEVYKNANPAYGYAPAMSQWGLTTEPWVFVVDRRGKVAAKFEGPTPASEIQPVLNRALHA